MRTFFHSTTRPKHVAERLHHLLPALTRAQCLAWTAKVFGYRDWHDLAEVTKQALHPPSPDLGDASDPAVNIIIIQQTKSQKEVLTNLLGDQAFLAESLYDEWTPYLPGVPRATRLNNIGKGSPAYNLLQYEMFPEFNSGMSWGTWDSQSLGSGDVVTELPPEQEAALTREFLAKLTRSRAPYQGYARQLADALRLRKGENWQKSTVTSDDEEPDDDEELAARFPLGLGTQWRSARLFALSEEGKLVGVAVFRFHFTSTVSGRFHEMEIEIEEAAVLEQDAEVQLALGCAAADLFGPAVRRYAWSRIGNSNKDVSVMYLTESESQATWAIAKDMDESIADTLNLPGRQGRSVLGLDIGYGVSP